MPDKNRTPLPVPRRKVLKFVDDDTYMFITTPEGNTVEVENMIYHTAENSLQIFCGEHK